jgi:hypothetical protein
LPSQGNNFDNVFVAMVQSAVKLGLMDEYFLKFLDAVGKLPTDTQFRAFFSFIDSIKNSELSEKYIDALKSQFLALVLGLKSSEVKKFRLDYFVKLFEIAKELEFLDVPEVRMNFSISWKNINIQRFIRYWK